MNTKQPFRRYKTRPNYLGLLKSNSPSQHRHLYIIKKYNKFYNTMFYATALTLDPLVTINEIGSSSMYSYTFEEIPEKRHMLNLYTESFTTT